MYILRGLYLLYFTFDIVSDHMLKVWKTLSAYCLRLAQGRKRKLGIKVGEKRFLKSFGLDYPLLSTNYQKSKEASLYSNCLHRAVSAL